MHPYDDEPFDDDRDPGPDCDDDCGGSSRCDHGPLDDDDDCDDDESSDDDCDDDDCYGCDGPEAADGEHDGGGYSGRLADGTRFADPGGSSALRAASRSNPRNLACPTCHAPNRLTPADRARGYQCDSCANRAEHGGW